MIQCGKQIKLSKSGGLSPCQNPATMKRRGFPLPHGFCEECASLAIAHGLVGPGELEKIDQGPPPCNHTKVYSKTVLMSDPPQHPWICSVCLEEGVDRDAPPKGPTFDGLRERKAELKRRGVL